MQAGHTARLLDVDPEHWEARHVRPLAATLSPRELHNLVWEKFLTPETRSNVRAALLQEVMRAPEPREGSCMPFLAIASRQKLPRTRHNPTGRRPATLWHRLVHDGVTVGTLGSILTQLLAHGEHNGLAKRWELATRGLFMAPHPPLQFALRELQQYVLEVLPDLQGTLERTVRIALLAVVKNPLRTPAVAALALFFAVQYGGRHAPESIEAWVAGRASWIMDTIVAQEMFAPWRGTLDALSWTPRCNGAVAQLAVVVNVAVAKDERLRFLEATTILPRHVVLGPLLPVLPILRTLALERGRLGIWSYLAEGDTAGTCSGLDGDWKQATALLNLSVDWLCGAEADLSQQDVVERAVAVVLRLVVTTRRTRDAPEQYQHAVRTLATSSRFLSNGELASARENLAPEMRAAIAASH